MQTVITDIMKYASFSNLLTYSSIGGTKN